MVVRRSALGTVFQIELTGPLLISRSHWIRTFTSWNLSPDVTEGSPEYYSKQVYSQGTRCWNGPQRNVKVLRLYPFSDYCPLQYSQLDLTCGTENALLTVIELEKCEYLFTGTTPALCLPLEEDRESGRDEL